MEIYNSAKDLRVVICTPDRRVLDVPAIELEVEDAVGRFTLTANGDPALAAVVPSTMILRKRDGSELHIEVTWGSLTAASGQVRVVVNDCSVVYVEPMRVAV
jgi:F0F1-type ATP synthase epsilon subunit